MEPDRVSQGSSQDRLTAGRSLTMAGPLHDVSCWKQHPDPQTGTPRSSKTLGAAAVDNHPLDPSGGAPHLIWQTVSEGGKAGPHPPKASHFHDETLPTPTFTATRPVTRLETSRRQTRFRDPEEPLPSINQRRRTMAAVETIHRLLDIEENSRIFKDGGIAYGFEEDGSFRMEALFSRYVLERLEPYFDDGPLPTREFTRVMCECMELDDPIAKRALPHLFRSIDCYETGNVSWHDLCNHLSQEYVQRTGWAKSVSHVELSTPGFVIPDRPHHGRLPIRGLDFGAETLFLFAEDGLLSVWTKSMELKVTRSMRTPEMDKERPFGKWFTDIVLVPKISKAIVTTGDKEVQWFELPNVEPYCMLNHLQCVPYRVDAALLAEGQLVLTIGDMDGCVLVIIINNTIRTLRTWNECDRELGFPATSYESAVRNGEITVYNWKVHGDMTSIVKYSIPLRQVISCSTDPATSIVIGCSEPPLRSGAKTSVSSVDSDVSGTIRHRQPWDQVLYKVPHGVRTMDVWEERRLIAAGGIDRVIRIWTIFTRGKPFQILKGHTFPIFKLIFHPAMNVIISISTSKNIRVWDLKEYVCLCNITAAVTGIKGTSLNLLHYSKTTSRLLVQTSDDLITFQVCRMQVDDESQGSHSGLVVGLTYNVLFHVWVSCSKRKVKVWDVDTGRKTFEFTIWNKNMVNADFPEESLQDYLNKKLSVAPTPKLPRKLVAPCKAVDGSKTIENALKPRTKFPFNLPASADTHQKMIAVTQRYPRTCQILDSAKAKANWQRMLEQREQRIRHRYRKQEYVPDLEHFGEITCLGMEPTGRRLLTGHANGVIKEWNFSNGMSLRTLYRCGKAEEVPACAVKYVKFGKMFNNIVSVGWNKKVNIFAGVGSKTEPEMTWQCPKGGHVDDIWAVASCDPEILATGSYDGTVILWNYTSGHVEKRLKPPDFNVNPSKDNTKVTALLFFTKSRFKEKSFTLLFTAGPNNMIHMWEIKWVSREVFYRGKLKPWKNPDRFACCMVAAPDTNLILVGDNGGHVLVLDIEGVVAGGGIPLGPGSGPPIYTPPATPTHGMQKGRTYSLAAPAPDPEPAVKGPISVGYSLASHGMPLITRRWKAHSEGINSITVCEVKRAICTGAKGGEVRIWTFDGWFVGGLGQAKEWNINDPTTYAHPSLPKDVLTNLDDAYDAGLSTDEKSFEEVIAELEPGLPRTADNSALEVITEEWAQTTRPHHDYSHMPVYKRELPSFLCFEGRNKIVFKNSPGPHKYSLAPVNTFYLGNITKH